MNTVKCFFKKSASIAHSIFFKFNAKSSNAKDFFTTLLIFANIIGYVLCFYSTKILDYGQTILNIYETKYIKHDLQIVVTIFVLIVLAFILIKSAFELLFTIISKQRLNFVKSVSVYSFIISTVVLSSLSLYSFKKVNNYINNYVDDIATVKKIEDIISNASIDHKLYVNKIPYLYQKVGLKVESSSLDFFESLALKANEKNVVVAESSHPYYFLISNNYKYFRISDKTGIYARDPSIIKVLAANGIKLLNYYYTEVVNIQEFAKKQRLSYVAQKGVLLNSSNLILSNKNKYYLLAGKYRFTVQFAIDNVNNLVSDDIASIQVTASNQDIMLYKTPVKKDAFKDLTYNLVFDLNFNANFHDVEFLVKNISLSNQFYLKSLNFEKLPY